MVLLLVQEELRGEGCGRQDRVLLVRRWLARLSKTEARCSAFACPLFEKTSVHLQ